MSEVIGLENNKELNRIEWENPDNWTLPIGFYFSKKDSRWLVPRPNPLLGWTFNLGQKKGAWALLFSFLIPIVLLTGTLLILVATLAR
jgi:uncharacterized membrane protein